MKKVLFWILGIILAVVVLIFLLIFSPPGNAIVKPIAQSYIDKYSPFSITLTKFKLSPFAIDTNLQTQDKLSIDLYGDINIIGLGADLKLLVDAKDISFFGDMVNMPLKGAFKINATAKGNKDDIDITLQSDIAKGQTDIYVKMLNLTPKDIKANISNLQIEEILAIIGQKPYAQALLNVAADIKGDENMNFNGNAKVFLDKGKMDSKLIEDDFKIPHVPQTNFTTTLNAEFNLDTIKHELMFDSNIGKISSVGDTDIKTLSTKSTYSVNLSNLSSFSPLVGMPIRGAFKTNGEIIGGMEELNIKGFSDVANSNTSYKATLKNLAPHTASFDTKKLNLATALYMVNMPEYVKRNTILDAVGDVSDFASGMSINAKANVKGTTSNPAIKKAFDINMPDTAFTLNSDVKITKGKGGASVAFKSNLAEVTSKNIAIVLAPLNVSLNYDMILPDLRKLKFITDVELVGNIVANGEGKLSDKLYGTFNTKSLGGDVNGVLDGDALTGKITNLDIEKFFKMAQMPVVFSSKVNGDLKYDMKNKKGNVAANITNGKMLPNALTQISQTYFKTNLTNEVYDDATMNATIDNGIVNSNISLKSNNTKIESKNAILNLDKSTINAKIDVAIKDQSVQVVLGEKISNPSIKIDVSHLIKQEAAKFINKKINEELKEKGLEKATDLFNKLLKK